MNWYELLRLVSTRPQVEHDLSTGTPVLLPEIADTLQECLRELGRFRDASVSLGAYDPVDGLGDLRRAFAERCSTLFGVSFSEANVLVIPGAQAGLRYLHEIVRNEGRRICYPCNLEFPGAVDASRGALICVGTPSDGKSRGRVGRPRLDYEGVNWSDVGAVLLSRPHNPTGGTWTKSELMDLAERAAHQGAPLVLDETYALPFAPLTVSDSEPFHTSNAVHLYSFSKVGLAAERVGVVVGASALIDQFRRVLRRNAILASRVGQHLALALVRHFLANPRLATQFGREYRRRWSLMASQLLVGDESAHYSLSEWRGGPFLWCEWQGGPTSESIFHRLLDRGVAVAPAEVLMVNDATGLDSSLYPRGLRIGLGADARTLEAAGAVIAEVLAESFRGEPGSSAHDEVRAL